MARARQETFGALLRQHRKARGLTQETLAERAGISVRTLNALERGEQSPRDGTVELLAEALGAPRPTRGRACTRPSPCGAGESRRGDEPPPVPAPVRRAGAGDRRRLAPRRAAPDPDPDGRRRGRQDAPGRRGGPPPGPADAGRRVVRGARAPRRSGPRPAGRRGGPRRRPRRGRRAHLRPRGRPAAAPPAAGAGQLRAPGGGLRRAGGRRHAGLPPRPGGGDQPRAPRLPGRGRVAGAPVRRPAGHRGGRALGRRARCATTRCGCSSTGPPPACPPSS